MQSFFPSFPFYLHHFFSLIFLTYFFLFLCRGNATIQATFQSVSRSVGLSATKSQSRFLFFFAPAYLPVARVPCLWPCFFLADGFFFRRREKNLLFLFLFRFSAPLLPPSVLDGNYFSSTLTAADSKQTFHGANFLTFLFSLNSTIRSYVFLSVRCWIFFFRYFWQSKLYVRAL